MHDLDLPRVAIYSIWGNTQDVGWVRYAFDKFEVPYDLIYKERVKKGDLQGAYDVIVDAEPGRKRQAAGVRHREPRPADRIQEERTFKNLGVYGESGRHHRRHGTRGRRGVRRSSSRPAACSSRSARRATSRPSSAWRRRLTRARTSAQFYAPGPIIDAEILQPEHPIFYGYDKKIDPGPLRRTVRCSACRPARIRSSRRRRDRRRRRRAC